MSELPPDQIMVPEWMRSVADGSRLELLGGTCLRCGVTFFPRTARCKACGSPELCEAVLKGPGLIHSVTVDAQGAFLGRPHLVGQVQFPEGAFVQGFVDAPVERRPAIGSEVDVVPFALPAPEGAGSLVTYAFRPREVV